MGLFQSIFKGKVTDRAAGSGYRFPFGQSSAGKPVNERTAMQMTAVYAAVRILAEGVASLPLHVYRRGENGDRSKAEDLNLFYLLHDKPNPEMTSFIFREALMCHLLLFGNAYAQVLRNGRGEVAALYPDWRITEFSAVMVRMERQPDMFCPDHMVLMPNGAGYLCVYENKYGDAMALVSELSVELSSLPSAVQEELAYGIGFSTADELEQWLESAES